MWGIKIHLMEWENDIIIWKKIKTDYIDLYLIFKIYIYAQKHLYRNLNRKRNKQKYTQIISLDGKNYRFLVFFVYLSVFSKFPTINIKVLFFFKKPSILKARCMSVF